MSVGAPIRTQGPVKGGTIAERSVPGRRAFSFPALDVPEVAVPPAHARAVAPALPEVAEIDLVRHYTRLSQMNYGVDTGAYPLGSCTMKYNPKVAETVAALPGFQRLHPLQPDATVQGALELLWRLEQALCAITGMAARHPAASGRGVRGDDGPADHAGLPRRTRRAPHEGADPRLRPRHEPGQRAPGRVRRGAGAQRRARHGRRGRAGVAGGRARWRASC